MIVDEPRDLTPGAQLPIELSAELLARVEARRAEVLRALSSGDPVYGVTTGMGALSKVRLSDEEQRTHQRNLLLGRAVGGPPWLPPDQARAVVVTRLRTFLTGDAGVSAALCGQLVALINSPYVPAIPAEGAGSAGEIIPLAHAFGPLTGIGTLLDADGREVPAEGLLPPFELGPKEGIALLAGIPGTTGRAYSQVRAAERLADRMAEIAAGAIAVIGANRDPYHPSTGRGDELLQAEQTRILELAGPESQPRSLQAPVSFRVVPQVLAHVRRALGRLDEAVTRALDGVTDSPAYLDGAFVGTAGFHGIDLAAHCDHLVAALAHAAEVSTARLHRLLDPEVTGLPAQLAYDPGPQAGLVAVHKRAVAAVHSLRRLTVPSSIGTAETSNGQEDVQTFSWEAAGVLTEAVRLTREVTACELLAVHQAFFLAKRPVPVALAELLGATADAVPVIEADRPFGVDLRRLADLLSSGSARP
ncbi:histidine ammonia-lyase [Kribbella amoyensis]|uniref:Histidine ammonia-lyase n=1 Tax=Kribbella amoyensis TaxID=996641 RepID=A0A561BRA8_9ACTN|nr:aromatic amino acid lyase [Kribbella amoyensis]TWD81430.1 histidine ammonia-lyase [Kribbella amoyensis]